MPYILSLLPIIPTALILFSLSWISSDALAQNTVTECGPNLLSLAPCGPFVQGMAAAPVQTCCDSIDKLYIQKPNCLCLLLNNTGLASSFPINTTLALQLPLLCNLQIDPSTCPGNPVSALSPQAQVSFGEGPKSGAAGGISASPLVTRAPTPRFVAFGLHHSAEVRLKGEGQLLMLLLAATYTVLIKYIY